MEVARENEAAGAADAVACVLASLDRDSFGYRKEFL